MKRRIILFILFSFTALFANKNTQIPETIKEQQDNIVTKDEEPLFIYDYTCTFVDLTRERILNNINKFSSINELNKALSKTLPSVTWDTLDKKKILPMKVELDKNFTFVLFRENETFEKAIKSGAVSLQYTIIRKGISSKPEFIRIKDFAEKAKSKVLVKENKNHVVTCYRIATNSLQNKIYYIGYNDGSKAKDSE